MDCPLSFHLCLPYHRQHTSSSLSPTSHLAHQPNTEYENPSLLLILQYLPSPSLSLLHLKTVEAPSMAHAQGPGKEINTALGTSRMPGTSPLGLTRTKDVLNISVYTGFWNDRVRLRNISKHEFNVQLGRGLYLIICSKIYAHVR